MFRTSTLEQCFKKSFFNEVTLSAIKKLFAPCKKNKIFIAWVDQFLGGSLNKLKEVFVYRLLPID